jgi:transcriptional regulator with XRE-family HTH domain
MEPTHIDQGTRLQKLIKALKMNQVSFARSLGMTQPNISRMASGENKVSSEALNRITQVHKQVNIHWLLTGEGDMFFGQPEEKPGQVKEPEGPYASRGKGRLEDMEDRLERLEASVKRLMDELGLEGA